MIISVLFMVLWVWALMALDDIRRSQRETAATLARLASQLERLERTNAEPDSLTTQVDV